MPKLSIDGGILGPPRELVQAHKTRKELKGALVICFLADGCMAHDHKFRWVGRIYDFEHGLLANEPQGKWTWALVHVIKSDDRSGDVRDGFVGHERVMVENGAFQWIGPGLYFLYL